MYLPKDRFYDFQMLQAIEGQSAFVTSTDVDFTTISLHIRGGAVLLLHVNSTIIMMQFVNQGDPDILGIWNNASPSSIGKLMVH
jgi:alpha-glucosidase (family GH31 glycosyl hydrolase)